MALNLDTAIRISANVQGGNQIQAFSRDIRNLETAAKVSSGDLGRMNIAINRMAREAGNTTTGLRQHISALQTLRDRVDINSNAYRRLGTEIEGLRGKLRGLDGDAKRTGETLSRGGVGSALRGGGGAALGALATGGGVQGAAGALTGSMLASGSAAALAGAAGITAAIGVGALAARVGVDAETAQVRLKALTDQFGEYNAAQSAAARIAQTLRISTTEAQDGFSQLYAALRPTGVTLQEVEDAFVGFTAAARISGATATESSAALLQLKQALGSGVLQGDELRSIREQAPLVGQAIAKEMGVTVGELKKLGSEGQITTDIVIRALAKLKGEKLDQLNAQFDTSAQAMKDLQTASEDFGRSVARVFGPTTVELVKTLAFAVQALNSTFEIALGNQNALNNAGDWWRARLQAEKDVPFSPRDILPGSNRDRRVTQRINQLFRQYQSSRPDQASDSPTSSQQAARDAAAGERQAARNRAAAANEQASQKAADKARREQEKAQREAEKAQQDQLDYQNDLFNIRLNFEKRLADFREQSLDRAKQMERDIGDQRLQLERSTDELRRRSEGQTQDFLLKLERDRLAAIGGDTSALDFEIEMTKVRRDASEQLIRNEQDAADRKLTLERSVENYRRTVAEGIRDITIDAGQQWADRVRKGATDAVATLGGATATGGGSAIFGSTGNVRNAPGWVHGHFQTNSGSLQSLMQDVLPVVRGLVSRGVPTELANGQRFTQGMSDAQIMSLLRQGAMLHSHSGDGRSIDIFVPQGTRVPGAVLDVRNTGGRGGVTGMLPGSGSSWVGHLDPASRSGGGSVSAANNIRPTPTAARNLQAELRPATPLQPLNAAMLQVPGMEGINAATAGVLQASDAQRLAANALPPSEVLAKLGEQYGDITQELGQQQRSSRQQLEDYQRILTLQRSGLSPELAQQSVERARSAEREATQLQALENQTVQYLQQAGLTDKQRQTAQALLEATRERALQLPDITANLDREAATLERLRDLEQQRQALIQGMANTIGGGLGSALDLLIEGTENWGNSLRGIASGVLKDIAKQLVQIYAVQPATKGLQSLLGNLFGGGNPAGAAAAAGAGASVYTMPMLSGVPAITGAFANGGIMTSAGPLPLRAYANGGIAAGPQLALFGEGRRPEAYVPLPDGRRIPVAMQGGGGGGSVVNVTVNAEGSAVQGDSGRSEQLGQVVARAIQEEMIRQRRPGGLLAQ